jgi:peptidylprolyl isomerase
MKLASNQSFTALCLGLVFFMLEACSENATPAPLIISPANSPVPTITGSVVRLPSGLKYIEVRTGSGNEAKIGKQVTIEYTGYLTNGYKFDSTLDHGQPYTFKLGEGMHLKGLEEGITGMRVGGERRLIIPPELGYGSRGKDPVPPEATLIFDVDLLKAK